MPRENANIYEKRGGSAVRDGDGLREKLALMAETILPPELAILIECALESESEPKAAEFLRGLIARFNECALRAIPLRGGGRFELYERAFEDLGGTGLLVGILADGTLSRETAIRASAAPGDPEFEELVAEAALELDLSPISPVVLGVGAASSKREAGELARRALFRPADKRSPEPAVASAERRILARLNSRGPGAGGFGGRHTALAVAAEGSGRGYVALAPGDYFTSRARAYY
jgi:tartrate dehydratase alpha subunit/fumarate hydratase class I-like protein